MQSHVEKYFDNQKLRKIMQYTLVFLGGSPRNTPALYNLISHVDFNLGVYYPEGGMTNVADSISELAEELGATIQTNTEVEKITKNNKLEVRTTDETYNPDAVISNADYPYTEMNLLDEEHRTYSRDYWETKTYAPSAFLMYLGIEGEIDQFEHHTLVLPTDWDHHFEKIFEKPELPDDPAYYICCPSRTTEKVAPEGDTSLFILVPIAPGLKDNEEIRSDYRELILDDIEENTDVELRERIEVERIFSINDFNERYNSYRGTALGLAHTLQQTSIFRPRHRSKSLRGLYYTGAYTNPGIGVPMCLISGEHTAEKVINDLS